MEPCSLNTENSAMDHELLTLLSSVVFNQDDLKVLLGCRHGQLRRRCFHERMCLLAAHSETKFSWAADMTFKFVRFFCRKACSVWWQFLEAITTEAMNDGCRVNICMGTVGSRCAGVDGLISQFLQPVIKKYGTQC